MLSDKSPLVRVYAAECCRILDPNHSQSIALIIKELRNRDPKIRILAISTICQDDIAGVTLAKSDLLALMDDDEKMIAVRAIYLLFPLKPVDLRYLSKLMKISVDHNNVIIKRTAGEYLEMCLDEL